MTFIPAIGSGPPAAGARCAWFVVCSGGLVVRRNDGRAVLPTDDDVGRLGLDLSGAQLLGQLDDAQALALHLPGPASAVAPPLEVFALRAIATSFEPELFGVAGRALHVIDWLTTSRFCGRCGAATAPKAGDRCMACPRCGLEIYPRIAPAIIVLVRRGPQALLARNARFPAAFYSTLAGFSEIGESLEQTLAREVLEEVGVEVTDVRYFGSQPWPFPHSLMIGFNAEWAGGEIRIHEAEIADARWFTVDELPMIPPSLSIARRLIDAWIADVRGARV